ncbi:hypothetical protein CEXT_157921 [Caerostris extrusa]|uniref:Uncharacterized protein n=1 Tax=Caerostris extrusa TaxID=172846 RepID=A0AAV4X851_CAEEX|nr:hypothetical protein CEXT_157921 [Caerostris extrusa]
MFSFKPCRRRVRIWWKHHESMDVTPLQADCRNVMILAMFSWHALDSLIQVSRLLNKASYFNIGANLVHPIMLIVYPHSNSCFNKIAFMNMKDGLFS